MNTSQDHFQAAVKTFLEERLAAQDQQGPRESDVDQWVQQTACRVPSLNGERFAALECRSKSAQSTSAVLRAISPPPCSEPAVLTSQVMASGSFRATSPPRTSDTLLSMCTSNPSFRSASPPRTSDIRSASPPPVSDCYYEAACSRPAASNSSASSGIRSQFTRSSSAGRILPWEAAPREASPTRTLPFAHVANKERTVSAGGVQDTPRRDVSPRETPRSATSVPVSLASPRALDAQSNSLPRGPERFFYDKGKYTGCARFQGEAPPPVVARGTRRRMR